MVVDVERRALGEGESVGEAVYAAQLAEVERHHGVGVAEQHVGALAMAGVDGDVVKPRQTAERRRRSVGRHHLRPLSAGVEHRRKPQRRPYGIAVGRHVARQHHIALALEKRGKCP